MKFKDKVMNCLFNTVTELGSSTEETSNFKWTNADLFCKTETDVVVKFRISFDEEGAVQGRVTSWKINDDGEPEPIELKTLLNHPDIPEELKEEVQEKLTDEGPPKDYLMN